MSVTKTAKVWLGAPKGITDPIRVSQYDTGWQFELTVYDGDSIYVGTGGEIVVLNGHKPNGAAFSVAGTFASGVATFDCPITITEAVGVTECELRLTSSGETVGTANFDMIIEKAPLSGYYASGEDFSAVAQLIDNMIGRVPGATGAWLAEHITNPSNPPIDTSLTVAGAAADAEKAGEIGKALTFVTPKTVLKFLQKGISDNGEYYDSNIRCATENMTPERGLYRIHSVRDDIKFLLWRDTELRGGDQSNVLVQVDGETDIAIVAKLEDNGIIDPETASRSVWIERYTPQELTEETMNGTGLMILGDAPLCHSYITTQYYGLTSLVYKMPRSGVQVGKITSGGGANGFCTTRFCRMTNGMLTDATDYVYGNTRWDGETPTLFPTKNTIYYPWEDNLYFYVVFAKGSQESDYGLDKTFISYGSVRDGNGRLTNLAQASCGYGVNPAPNQDVTGPYPSFTTWVGAGYTTQQNFYGTILRLRDASAICCSADLSLLCWWYDSDGNLLGKVHGGALTNYAFTGINNIDLTSYGEDGYAFVLIRAPFTAKEPVEGQTLTALDEQTMGGIHLRDYVFNNVFVRYKNGTTINHTGGLHPVLADNIERFKAMDFGRSFGFNYSGPVTRSSMKMAEMQHMAPVFYAGKSVANTFLQNVSIKSFATALKNPNSQVYISDYMSTSPVYGKITERNFGTTCNSLPFILYGWTWMVRAAAWAQSTVNFPDVTVYRDFDFINRYDEVHPGDWVVGVSYADTEQGREEDDAHILFVTDVIYVNGAVSAIECIENYPPMVRYRYLFLDPMLDRFNLQFSRREPLDTFYQILVRPDRTKIVPLEEAFGPLTTDYDVGTIMCDRGTDSVYCPRNPNCRITVSDPAVEQIDVYKGGTFVASIDLDDLPETVDSVNIQHSANFTGPTNYRTIDIIRWIRALASPEGYYTLKADGGEDVQESFYVTAETPQTIRTEVVDDEVQLSLSNPDDVVYVVACYLPPTTDPNYDKTWNRVKVTLLPERIEDDGGVGVMSFPRIVSYKGESFTFNWTETIYKTSYGTYWVMRDDQDVDSHGVPIRQTFYNSDGSRVLPVFDQEG